MRVAPQGGHALAVLPGLTHYNLGASPLFAAVTLDFLEADLSLTVATPTAAARISRRAQLPPGQPGSTRSVGSCASNGS